MALKRFHIINIDSWQIFLNQSHCKCFKNKTIKIRHIILSVTEEILWARWMWMWPADFLNTRGCQWGTWSHGSHVMSCGKLSVQLQTILLSLCFSWSVLGSWWNGIIIPNLNILHLLHPKENKSFFIMLKQKRVCGNPKITLTTKKGYLQMIWFTFSVSLCVCVEREGCQHVANTSLQYSQSLQTCPARPGLRAEALWAVWAPEPLR